MSVAIRTITRLQDADDAPALGAGQDGYALTWDNATGAFVATALIADHGALTGLNDDDHTGYVLLAGRAGGQTLYGGTAANDDITIHGTSNATRTTSYVLLQPTAGNVGIGTSAPGYTLHVEGGANLLTAYFYNNTGGSGKTTVVIRAGAGNATTGTSEPVLAIQNSAGTQKAFIRGDGLIGSTLLGTTDDISAMLVDSSSAVAAYPRGLNLGQISVVSWASASAWWQTKDIGLSRGAAGVLYVGNGSQGSSSGTLIATTLGLGVTTPSTALHVLLTSAVTNAVTNVVTIGHDTSGTAANGFGAGQLFTLESSTTAAQSAARIQALWYEATHATRKADLVLTAYDTAEREGLRIRGAGSAPAIGFLGATPAARIAHVADPSGGATVDAEARSAINSILATLETFGFHATS